MTEETIKKLVSDYERIAVGQDSFVKYSFTFKGVNVRVYFDNFDNSMQTMMLVLTYGGVSFFTTRNMKNTYIEEIPKTILFRILENNSTAGFFKELEKHIMSSTPHQCNADDGELTAAMRNVPHEKRNVELPFLHYFRKQPMSDKTFHRLKAICNIDNDTLWAIKKRGFTIVRTDDISKRKTLAALLKENGIKK